MARKPLSQLSPAYRKRIERGIAAGKSRQAARGKPVAEHVVRRRRERAKVAAGEKKITDSQLSAMRDFVYRQAARQRRETKFEMWARMKDWMRGQVQDRGYEWFLELRASTRAKEGSPKIVDIDDLEGENDFDGLDVPREYIALRFYA